MPSLVNNLRVRIYRKSENHARKMDMSGFWYYYNSGTTIYGTIILIAIANLNTILPMFPIIIVLHPVHGQSEEDPDDWILPEIHHTCATLPRHQPGLPLRAHNHDSSRVDDAYSDTHHVHCRYLQGQTQ